MKKEPIRILHIVHTLNRGGMESRIMDVYRNLDHNMYQYDFYVESGIHGEYDDEIMTLGGCVFYNSTHKKYNLPYFKGFAEFIRTHDEYKIVYSYNQWSGTYLKISKKYGVPYRIANSRTSVETMSLKNLLKNPVKINANRYSTHRFAVSKKAAIWLFGKKAVDHGNVLIWPNAIDTEKYAFSDNIRDEIRHELGLENAFTVIHVGNIRFEKNHTFLLRVFAEIKKCTENAVLLLIGGGDFATLSKEIDELNIKGNVIFLGVRNDIPRLLQAGDLFVFPSLYEGFPGAVLEAESSGLNCLISDSITSEVMILESVKALSLDKPAVEWAETALSFSEMHRQDAWEKVKKNGYDITDLVHRTEAFYTELVQ